MTRRRNRSEGSRRPNRASSIYYGDDGLWHGWVTMGTRDNGRPDRRHVKRSTEGEVIKAVRKLEQMRDSGKVQKPGRAWTVEKWLRHWVENVAAPSVKRTTMVGYRSSVYNHLIPGIGAHRIDKLTPEHLEALYRKLEASGEFKAATVHLAHRVVRIALNEAVRRRHLTENPATIAKAPRVADEEIVPFSHAEAQRLIEEAGKRRNGARYIVALALGLRRGEALGLKWSDISIRWGHGCPQRSECRQRNEAPQCGRRRGSGTMTIRRNLQLYTWNHGCPTDNRCGHEKGAYCPQRHGGGMVATEVKSRAGRRTVGLPQQVVEALEAHRLAQDEERQRASNLWDEADWIFTTRRGKPVHTSEDHREWKALLRDAEVRDARLHDARHTAATVLLVLKVPLPAVMELMGWSDASIAKRYMHVTDDMAESVAEQVGSHMWAKPQSTGDEVAPTSELTEEQRDAARSLRESLPQHLARQLDVLLADGDDDGGQGSSGVPVPA